jgi:hypothetical protein
MVPRIILAAWAQWIALGFGEQEQDKTFLSIAMEKS